MAVDGYRSLTDSAYQRSRAWARRRPTWWLRRREAQIIAIRPRPSAGELGELCAIRKELSVRAVGRAPVRWRPW
jgi:hypothetical protein